MKLINYIKYIFGVSAYLGFREWAKRDKELSDLFLNEIKKEYPDYFKAELLHKRMVGNFYMWKNSIKPKSDFTGMFDNAKPNDVKL